MDGRRPEDELQALAWLREHDEIWLHELPDFVSLDTLRGIDIDGFIEAMPWMLPAAGDWQPVVPPGWSSPAANQTLIGTWARIWKRYTGPQFQPRDRLCVRLTESGHTAARRGALAPLKGTLQQEFSPPPPAVGTQAAAGYPVPSESPQLGSGIDQGRARSRARARIRELRRQHGFDDSVREADGWMRVRSRLRLLELGDWKKLGRSARGETPEPENPLHMSRDEILRMPKADQHRYRLFLVGAEHDRFAFDPICPPPPETTLTTDPSEEDVPPEFLGAVKDENWWNARLAAAGRLTSHDLDALVDAVTGLVGADWGTRASTTGSPASATGTQPPNVEAKGHAKRPRRDTAQITADNDTIRQFLQKNPEATRDQVAKATGIAQGHVSESRAWKAHKKLQEQARQMEKASKHGIGGVGDPTTDLGHGRLDD